jgi:UDP-N-acetylmuramate--alanine ligase
LLATVLIKAGIDPTVVVGGRLDLIKSTAKLGGGEWLVAEADESDGSFLSLVPEIAVITNIDNDHMDHYGNLENLKRTFFDFGLKVPFYGFVVACGDEKAVREAFAEFPKRIIYYGFQPNNDFVLKREKGGYQVFQGSECMGSFFPQMPGDHNALNALAAIVVSTQLGLKFEVAVRGIEEFQGVDRRFQIKGEVDGCKVYDDYGHHPTEIKAVLKAVRDRYPDKRVVLAFQPHRFSRTKLCWRDFLSAFKECDQLLLTNIYPAGEEPIEGITSENLFKEIELKSKKFYPALTAQNLKENIRNGDILLTMGAGPIWKTAEELVNEYGKN